MNGSSILPNESEQPIEDQSSSFPDIRVISVIYDAEGDLLKVSHDDDLIGPFEALGLLVTGTFKQMLYCADIDDVLHDEDDESDE